MSPGQSRRSTRPLSGPQAVLAPSTATPAGGLRVARLPAASIRPYREACASLGKMICKRRVVDQMGRRLRGDLGSVARQPVYRITAIAPAPPMGPKSQPSGQASAGRVGPPRYRNQSQQMIAAAWDQGVQIDRPCAF